MPGRGECLLARHLVRVRQRRAAGAGRRRASRVLGQVHRPASRGGQQGARGEREGAAGRAGAAVEERLRAVPRARIERQQAGVHQAGGLRAVADRWHCACQPRPQPNQ